MPNYQFLDTKTGEEYTKFLHISDLDEYLEGNVHVNQIIGAPAIGDSVRQGLKKPDEGFRDVLREIKKKNSIGQTKSTINTY